MGGVIYLPYLTGILLKSAVPLSDGLSDVLRATVGHCWRRGELRKIPHSCQALLRISAPFGAAQIEMWVLESILTTMATPCSVASEELDKSPTRRARHFVDIFLCPITLILSWTFHHAPTFLIVASQAPELRQRRHVRRSS